METMEARMVKLYARNNNHVALHAIPGHFATSHSHINFYIDMTSLKTRANEAQEVAKSLAGDYVNSTVVDTIVCMDGTEVVGTYLIWHRSLKNAVFATLTCMIRFMWSHRSIMRTIS